MLCRATIDVTSLMERDWQGTVVSVRASAPVDDAATGQEIPVTVSSVRLAGSISDSFLRPPFERNVRPTRGRASFD